MSRRARRPHAVCDEEGATLRLVEQRGSETILEHLRLLARLGPTMSQRARNLDMGHSDQPPDGERPMTPIQKTVAAAALATLASTMAAAQTPPAASHDPAAVVPGDYVVEPNHTQILFGVSHMGFTTYYGWFSGASGTLTLAKDVKADKLSIAVPVGSVRTTSDKLDAELTSAQWFDAAAYPQATFVSTAVRRTGPNTADVTGTLTFHGKTHPLVLHARFVGTGVNPLDKAITVGFSATGTIKRSLWGVSTYIPLIGDDVALTLSGAFEKH